MALGPGETGHILANRPPPVTDRKQATRALRDFRARGGKIRTQTWYQLWSTGEDQAAAAYMRYRRAGGTERATVFYRAWGQVELEGLDNNPQVLGPLNRRPTRLGVMETKSATGIMQRIRIFAVDQDHNIHVRDASVTSRTGLTRNNAIRRAIDISSAPDRRHSGSDLRHLRTIAAFQFAAVAMVPR